LRTPVVLIAPTASIVPPPAFKPWLDDFDPPHKQVDFNSICVSIMRYAKENEAVLHNCKVTTCEACNNRCLYFYKHEAALDIIALLHTGYSMAERKRKPGFIYMKSEILKQEIA
jgi:hypothetical protein